LIARFRTLILIAVTMALTACANHRVALVRLKSGDSLRESLIRAGRGIKRSCTIAEHGHVYGAESGKQKWLIQQSLDVPLQKFLTELGCKDLFICTTDGRTVTIERIRDEKH